MAEHYRRTRKRGWATKFRDALHGLGLGIRGQDSFLVHLPAGVVVMLTALALRLSIIECSLLALCITIVLTAELFNSSLERMARAIDGQHNVSLGQALDIAASAVLVASLGAAIVGSVVMGSHVISLIRS